MGAGVAEATAEAGYRVVLVDVSQDALDTARSAIRRSRAARLLLSGGDRSDVRERIAFSTDDRLLRDAHVVVENVTEDVAVKRAAHRRIDELCRGDALRRQHLGDPDRRAGQGHRPPRTRRGHPLHEPRAATLRQEIPDDQDMFASGLVNSLFAMTLVAYLESEFAITIESEDLDRDNFRTVDAISGFVARKRSVVVGESHER
jgi:acyl carrier protein